MKRLMSTRRASAPFSENSPRNQNGTNDSSKIMSSIDDKTLDNAHDHEYAHDNPGSSAHVDEDFGTSFSYPGKNSTSFQNDMRWYR